MARTKPRVVIFACNWNAYQSLDQAGKQHRSLPPGILPLKVECMGQIGPSIILKALEKGADGVLLVGCTPEECHYEFGSRRASELFDQVRQLAGMLGFAEEQLQLLQIHAGEGADLIARVQEFVDRLAAQTRKPLRSLHPNTTTEGAAGS